MDWVQIIRNPWGFSKRKTSGIIFFHHTLQWALPTAIYISPFQGWPPTVNFPFSTFSFQLKKSEFLSCLRHFDFLAIHFCRHSALRATYLPIICRSYRADFSVENWKLKVESSEFWVLSSVFWVSVNSQSQCQQSESVSTISVRVINTSPFLLLLRSYRRRLKVLVAFFSFVVGWCDSWSWVSLMWCSMCFRCIARSCRPMTRRRVVCFRTRRGCWEKQCLFC